MEWKDIIPLVVTVVIAVLGAYITVRVAIAELKKDKAHLAEKLDSEIESKKTMTQEHNENMKEVRDDVRAIFQTLTRIQVDVAKSQGRDEVLNTVRDAITKIANNN